jgi:hypothetical protein
LNHRPLCPRQCSAERANATVCVLERVCHDEVLTVGHVRAVLVELLHEVTEVLVCRESNLRHRTYRGHEGSRRSRRVWWIGLRGRRHWGGAHRASRAARLRAAALERNSGLPGADVKRAARLAVFHEPVVVLADRLTTGSRQRHPGLTTDRVHTVAAELGPNGSIFQAELFHSLPSGGVGFDGRVNSHASIGSGRAPLEVLGFLVTHSVTQAFCLTVWQPSPPQIPALSGHLSGQLQQVIAKYSARYIFIRRVLQGLPTRLSRSMMGRHGSSWTRPIRGARSLCGLWRGLPTSAIQQTRAL